MQFQQQIFKQTIQIRKTITFKLQNIKMGNRTGNVTSVDFNIKQWHMSDKQNSQNENKGNYKVLQNVQTGQLIDEYQLFWPTEEDFRFYLDSYYWRRQEYNIVPSRYIVEQHSDQFCSRSYGAKVYIEHIQTRLSDVTDIPYPDNLYVALAVLQGYQKLYENVHHYFPISEDQICVDREGIVKVWVNSDLSKNYPEPEQGFSQNKDEAHMVDELLNIVWENTDEESEPQSFKQFFARKKGKKRIGYDEAKVIVNEYAKNVSCQIPQKFNSILQMIEQSDYQQNQEQEYQENDQELQNIEGQQQYQDHEQHYLYNQQQPGYQVQYQNQQMHQQGQYYTGEPQSGNFYQPYQPQSQHFYHQGPLAPISHHVVPMFVPRQYTPHTGPIISIPPIRSNMTHINAPSLQNLSPNVFYHQGQAQNIHYPQYGLLHHQLSQKQHHDQQYKMHRYSQKEQQQQAMKIEPFGSANIQYQQHVSTLNPQMDLSENNGHQQGQQNEAQAYPSRGQLNNSVGRSLQLINKSSKKSQQNQRIRINKSHINELGEGVQVNYPQQYEQQAFNSRISGTGNSRMGDSGERGDRNYGQLQYIREQLLDTKYYTIDTEVELDEEIAADLKKMIMAL